ncbi:endolytic transglycosylase MltG [Patescibacteria group bacterium]|nr:endolytic transglycosylase MltG [Patescibacteria group bacterium]
MRKYFLFFILFLLLIFGVFFWKGIYLPMDTDSNVEKVFIVEKGEATSEIAYNLEKEGFIRSGSLFRVYTFLKGISGRLQAGEYLLFPGMTVPEITEKFISGKVVGIKITIPEGFTINQIEERLNRELKLKISNFTVNYFKQDFGFLAAAPNNASLEGFLFPDTYQFSYKINADGVLRKMLDNFDKQLNSEIREEIAGQNKSIFAIVTMASLIEKEVNNFEDRTLVSGVLWKRLENGIPLQVDATIIYITGKKTTRVSKEETKIDSPYNTYKYPGLPVGPISNPGIESILASVYPKDSPFWYYLSTPEGENIFSRTLEEHNIAKSKYLK